MKKSSISAEEKLDRKTIERNRRIHMKALCFKLVSLIPTHHFKQSKDMVSQQDQLDSAATYIKKMKEKIEELKERKRSLAMDCTLNQNNNNNNNNNNTTSTMKMVSSRLPMIELRDLGSSLEVIVISGIKKNFMSYEIIGIIEQGGAEVVSASFSIVGDKIFHSLHAQVKISRVGVDTPRIYERLQELVR